MKGQGGGNIGGSQENGSYLSSQIERVENDNYSHEDGAEIIRVLSDEGDEFYNSL